MRIDLYTRCWNDADMLGFLFRHYDPLVQRFVVYDDGSTDDSLEILRSNPKVEVRPTPPYSDLEGYLKTSRW
jgi:Glycosyl transferase family 2